jgi:hypothetical protein
MTLLYKLKFLENSFSPKNKNFSTQGKFSEKENYLKTENSVQEKFDIKRDKILKCEPCIISF